MTGLIGPFPAAGKKISPLFKIDKGLENLTGRSLETVTTQKMDKKINLKKNQFFVLTIRGQIRITPLARWERRRARRRKKPPVL